MPNRSSRERIARAVGARAFVMLVVLLAVTGAVSLRVCAADAPSAEILLSGEAAGPKPSEESIRAAREADQEAAREKLRRAAVELRAGNWQACITLADEALLLDPANPTARILKGHAIDARQAAAEERLATERHLRDQAMLRRVEEEGLVPPLRPDLPRRPLHAEALPFQPRAEEIAGVKARLAKSINEVYFPDTELDYVLQFLFETTGVSIIYDPEEVEGRRVSLRARDITAEEVLRYVARTQDIAWTIEGNAVLVYARDGGDPARDVLQTALIPLSEGLIRAGSDVAGGGEGGGDDGESHLEALLAWMEENWPGWPEGTTWFLEKNRQVLVVNSTPAMIEQVREMVGVLDVPPTQVMISVRFLTLGEETLDRLGFDWTLRPNPEILPETDADGNVTPEGFGDSKVRILGAQANAAVGGADGLQLDNIAVLNDHELTFTLNALDSTTGTKVLSAPRVIAFNNKWAEFKIVDRVPYPSDWETLDNSTVTDDEAVTSTTVVPTEWEEEEVGITLRVLPSVGANQKRINLRLQPMIRDRSGSYEEVIVTTDSRGNQDSVPITRPIFSDRTVTAEVAVEDGSTVVIGGLFRDDVSEGTRKTPFLGDIPVLRHLFTSKDNTRSRSCLLIFVTARLVSPTNQYYTDDLRQAEADLARQGVLTGGRISPEALDAFLGDPRPRPAPAP
jgi:type II secretory pathway component GspD/PulD (secretin)